MKIVQPKVELIGLMLPVEYGEGLVVAARLNPEVLIEIAGRTCYKSEDKITPESYAPFVDRVCNQLHHESVMEHSAVSFRIICDRGVSHEIVRHRIASYSQESTRYCNYGSDKFGSEISVIEPPGLTGEQRKEWLLTAEEAEFGYLNLLAKGCSPQIARSVLPNCLKTELVMTANFREWKHFLKLRTASAAHPQMREIATMIQEVLQKVAPTLFKEPVNG